MLLLDNEMTHVLELRLNSKLVCSGHSCINCLPQLEKVEHFLCVCVCVCVHKALFLGLWLIPAKQTEMNPDKAMVASAFQICWTGQEPNTCYLNIILERDIYCSFCSWIYTLPFAKCEVWTHRVQYLSQCVIQGEKRLFNNWWDRINPLPEGEQIKQQRSLLAKK